MLVLRFLPRWQNKIQSLTSQLVKAVSDSSRRKFASHASLGKQNRTPFPDSDSHSSRKPLELLHMDLCGPLPVKSKGGSRYILTVTDDVSRCSVIKFLTEKSQAKNAIIGLVKQLENQLDSKVKKFRTDRGREFLNKEMAQFCSANGNRSSDDQSVLPPGERSCRTPEPNPAGEGEGDASRSGTAGRALGRSRLHGELREEQNPIQSAWEDASGSSYRERSRQSPT